MPTGQPRYEVGNVGAGARVAQGKNIINVEEGAHVSIGDRSTRLIPAPSEQAPVEYVDRPELTGPLLAHLLGDDPKPRGRADH